MAGWSMLFALVYAVQCSVTTSQRFALDNKKLVMEILQNWQEKTGMTEPKYVAADVWYADMFALYGKNIKPFYWFDFQKNPEIPAEVIKQPLLVVADNEAEYELYAQKYGKKLSSPQKMPIEISNYFGKVKNKEIYYGFYNLKGLKR